MPWKINHRAYSVILSNEDILYEKEVFKSVCEKNNEMCHKDIFYICVYLGICKYICVYLCIMKQKLDYTIKNYIC